MRQTMATKRGARRRAATQPAAHEEKRVCAYRECTGYPSNREGFLCPRHWYRLPTELRHAIWMAHHKRDREASRAKVREALVYLREEDERHAKLTTATSASSSATA